MKNTIKTFLLTAFLMLPFAGVHAQSFLSGQLAITFTQKQDVFVTRVPNGTRNGERCEDCTNPVVTLLNPRFEPLSTTPDAPIRFEIDYARSSKGRVRGTLTCMDIGAEHEIWYRFRHDRSDGSKIFALFRVNEGCSSVQSRQVLRVVTRIVP